MREKTLKPAKLWILFRTCFVISACTFGGGMVIISMLQKKFAEELGWLSQDEVMDITAIAQSCPGVMAVNASIMIGYRIAGLAGSLLTMLGTLLPPILILTVISACYSQFRQNTVISLILRGMQAGVIAVMLSVTVSMIQNTLKNRTLLPLLLLVGSAAALLLLHTDIIPILIVCGVVGALTTIRKKTVQRGEMP